MMKLKIFLAPLVMVLFTTAGFSQVREDLSIEVVNVYVSATDKTGNFITDLEKDDLVVKEDGEVVRITHFSNFAAKEAGGFGEKGVPLNVAFVLDVSESMKQGIQGQQKIDIVKNAAFRILDHLSPDDTMMLVTFSETAEEITPATDDKKRMQQDLLFQEAEGGNTAILDAMYFAMEKLQSRFGRKIIVVCSDGEDTASYLKFDEVLANLIASDVTVLAFGTMALNSSSLRGRYLLKKMAEASGGYAFFPTSLDALDEVMDKLVRGMQSQYSIGYRPANRQKDGNWRKIEIACKRPGLKLRYREGYHAD